MIGPLYKKQRLSADNRSHAVIAGLFPPSLLTPSMKRPINAVRRMRTTSYCVCYAWNEGSPIECLRITPLGTPLMECRADLGQGGDASSLPSSHPFLLKYKILTQLCVYVDAT